VSTFLSVDFNGDSATGLKGLSNSVVSSFLNAAPGGVLNTLLSGLSNSLVSSFLKFGFAGEFTSDFSSLEELSAEGNLNGFAGGDSSPYKMLG
jgi:hypothetical protein